MPIMRRRSYDPDNRGSAMAGLDTEHDRSAGAGPVSAGGAGQPAPVGPGRSGADFANPEYAGPRRIARQQVRQLAGPAAAALYELLMLLPLLRILDLLAVPAWLDRPGLYAVPVLSVCGAAASNRLRPMWQRLALALAAGTAWLLADGGGWTSAGAFALTAGAVLQGATVMSRARRMEWYLSGVVIHAAASVLFAASPALRPLQDDGWPASLAVLAVAVFALNHRHLLEAALAENRPKAVPVSIRRHNRLYVAGLLIVATLLAGGLGGLLWQIVRDVLLAILTWLFRRKSVPEPRPVPSAEPQPGMPPMFPPPEEPAAWARILNGLALVLGWMMLASALVGAVFLVCRYGGPTLRKWLAAFLAFLNRRPAAPAPNQGYVDEETGLFSWEETIRRWKDSRIGRLLRSKRRERWEDMPDNRARVRFLYRRWLHRLSEAGYRPQRHLTPRETAADAAARQYRVASGVAAGNSVRTLLALYYEARYAEREPTDGEVASLLQGLDPGVAPPKR